MSKQQGRQYCLKQQPQNSAAAVSESVYIELIPDFDIENYLPGDPSAPDYVSEICIPVRLAK